MNSCMLLMSCFPTMMMKSCWASSMRQPPGPHCSMKTHRHTDTDMTHWNILSLWHLMVNHVTHIFIPHPEQGAIVSWVAHEPTHTEKKGTVYNKMCFKSCCVTLVSPSFEERHIEWGWVEVDKLEDEHFEDEGIVILCLCPVHLCNIENTPRHTMFKTGCCFFKSWGLLNICNYVIT